MNPLTLEWVQKAEVDFESAQLLSLAANPLHDAVCFHAQQCIEKYLKARLQEAGVRFPRTHDLEELLDLVIPSRLSD
jgi:HEPN domain-containing protein